MSRYIVVSQLNGKIEGCESIIEQCKSCAPEILYTMTISVLQFDDIPPVEGMPHGCAWGIFEKDGEKDV